MARGHECCANLVAELVRQARIAAKTKRKFCQTTDSNHPRPVAENLLDREFDPDEPNESWVCGITYVPTREGRLYLAVVGDLFRRMVAGWSMDRTIRLVVDALEMALARRLPLKGLRLRVRWRTRIVGPVRRRPLPAATKGRADRVPHEPAR